jgi:hypothetical protein
MLYRIIAWLLLLISFAGIFYSMSLLIKGSQPCSGDGCLIHILFIEGIIILIPSLILALFIIMTSFRKSKL